MANLLLGSHVNMAGPGYYLEAVRTALSYGANTFMIYTGAPQNTFRKPTSEMKSAEGLALMREVGIDVKNVIAHAPYIINLANSVKPETFELAVRFLKEELKRVAAFGIKTVVLHPGAHVGAGPEVGIKKIIEGLNLVLEEDDSDVIIALETMAGKGSEVGRSFAELKAIIDGVDKSERLGVCFDTCHVNDAGYNIHDVDALLAEFDEVVGLDRMAVLHINDSKNPMGAGKDRHENIGFGTIGFATLYKYITHPRLAHLAKILETPYVGQNAPYELEIAMIKAGDFDPDLKDKLGE